MNLTSMSKAELECLIAENKDRVSEEIISKAFAVREKFYGRKVYLRGLIEVSSYCKNDCFYCGIRRSNCCAKRYRLSEREIINCCDEGYKVGFRTFVIQGGEDGFFSDEMLCRIICSIKEKYPDCAVTLSLGEKSAESYRKLKDAGADRYLLRHETASKEHYEKIHPKEMLFENRKRCLYDLKNIGFQVGAGFMVGSPFQTFENLAEDLIFLKELQPQMVGIGPFIPHNATPFGEKTAGSLNLTVLMIALTRIMLPNCLLPATTALGTISKNGRREGLKAGANVIMPNISPQKYREAYSLYNGKVYSENEAGECIDLISEEIKSFGLELSLSRGDCAVL